MPDSSISKAISQTDFRHSGTVASAATYAESEMHKLVHQLKQPLTAIGTYAHTGSELIRNGLSDMAPLQELFEKISAQCTRTSSLSQQLGQAMTSTVTAKE